MSTPTNRDRKFNYGKGRTKQSFKNQTDINKILKRAQKTGTLSHLAKYQGAYGDFASFDFMEAQNQIARGNTIFAELPSEIRNEFDQSPAKFLHFVNDPANVDRLKTLLPGLAEPGRQMISLKPGATPQEDPLEQPGEAPTTAEDPPESGINEATDAS